MDFASYVSRVRLYMKQNQRSGVDAVEDGAMDFRIVREFRWAVTLLL